VEEAARVRMAERAQHVREVARRLVRVRVRVRVMVRVS
jgi:hypothetical protein